MIRCPMKLLAPECRADRRVGEKRWPCSSCKANGTSQQWPEAEGGAEGWGRPGPPTGTSKAPTTGVKAALCLAAPSLGWGVVMREGGEDDNDLSPLQLQAQGWCGVGPPP